MVYNTLHNQSTVRYAIAHVIEVRIYAHNRIIVFDVIIGIVGV